MRPSGYVETTNIDLEAGRLQGAVPKEQDERSPGIQQEDL